MSRRIVNDRLDALQTSTNDLHRRRFYNGKFYNTEIRSGNLGAGPNVVIDEFGITIFDPDGNKVVFYDINGNIWLNLTGTLTQVQTFNDGSGHNILYV